MCRDVENNEAHILFVVDFAPNFCGFGGEFLSILHYAFTAELADRKVIEHKKISEASY